MNGIPATPHPQPLIIDLVVEEYENIQVGKYYYVARRSFDPSGVPIIIQDYIASVVEKSPDMIGIDVRMTRHTTSGTEWVAATSSEDIQIYARSDPLTFFRPSLATIDSVPLMEGATVATSDSSSDSDSEPEPQGPVVVSTAEAETSASP